ncbi:hypothetical protein BVG19_g5389 [[Candida] boidinii]|nr:hypothetical protein BVG19_g5389 [[Candida] boidinii]OWB53008.1 hypothetical protein B5S27_g4593 [[Candida] boidinii]
MLGKNYLLQIRTSEFDCPENLTDFSKLNNDSNSENFKNHRTLSSFKRLDSQHQQQSNLISKNIINNNNNNNNDNDDNKPIKLIQENKLNDLIDDSNGYIKFTIYQNRKDSLLNLIFRVLLLCFIGSITWNFFDFTKIIKLTINLLNKLLINYNYNNLTILNDENLNRKLQCVLLFLILNSINLQIDYNINESLLIIPKVGVQYESVLMRRPLFGLFKSIMITLFKTACESMDINQKSISISGEPESDSPDAHGHIEEKENLTGFQLYQSEKNFIPMGIIKDMIINEGFKNFEVINYLSLIVKNTSSVDNTNNNIENDSNLDNCQLILLFPKLLPRRRMLETIWKTSRKYLQ